MTKTPSLRFDLEAGAGYIGLTGAKIEQTDELPTQPVPGYGVNVDLDADGKPVGIEILGPLGGTGTDMLHFASAHLHPLLAENGHDVPSLAGNPELHLTGVPGTA